MKLQTIRTYAAATAMLAAAACAAAADTDYVPRIHGVMRTRWEMETESGDSRFQVRNARVSLDGNIAPIISYYIQTDLCDRGKMKILDAFGRIRIVEGVDFQIGQFRMPFGIEPHIGPASYIFANRSFMGGRMCNYRKAGAKAMWRLPRTPLTVEAGVFNQGSMADHEEWSKSYSWSGKLTWTPGAFRLSGGVMSLRPSACRMYLYDGAVSWRNSNLKVAAEYMHQHYGNASHEAAHSWCVWGDYGRPLTKGFFDRWSVQARYDGITSHWNGVKDSETTPACNRITVGGTIGYRYKSVFADIRLDYEKYFYHSGTEAPVGKGDKVVAELVIRF
ncbi:MAG: OprO/OprP family phosphate-selective porin [Muribaculaceae bacterium]|nr:OprO/OprP family phosphate-selective porin [Muribaculaceae bacterium]